jgi:hypothetical protein
MNRLDDQQPGSIAATLGIARRPSGCLPSGIAVADAAVFERGGPRLCRPETRTIDARRDGVGALTAVGVGAANGAVVRHIDRAVGVTGGSQQLRCWRVVLIGLRQPGRTQPAEQDDGKVSRKTVHHLPSVGWVTIPVFDGAQARRFAPDGWIGNV